MAEFESSGLLNSRLPGHKGSEETATDPYQSNGSSFQGCCLSLSGQKVNVNERQLWTLRNPRISVLRPAGFQATWPES